MKALLDTHTFLPELGNPAIFRYRSLRFHRAIFSGHDDAVRARRDGIDLRDDLTHGCRGKPLGIGKVNKWRQSPVLGPTRRLQHSSWG